MRMTLDKSEERAAVDENAYVVSVSPWRSVVELKKRTRAKPARGWRRRENMIAEFKKGVTQCDRVRAASP